MMTVFFGRALSAQAFSAPASCFARRSVVLKQRRKERAAKSAEQIAVVVVSCRRDLSQMRKDTKSEIGAVIGARTSCPPKREARTTILLAMVGARSKCC